MKKQKLAHRIKELRVSKAWSQAQLAEVASLNIRTIQRLEHNGKASWDTLLAIASAFDIDVHELTSLLNPDTILECIATEDGLDISAGSLKITLRWLTPKSAFLIGLLLSLPAVYFILSSVAKYNLGTDFLFEPWEIFYGNVAILAIFNFISPVIFLGGLLAAGFLNLCEIISFSFYKTNGLLKSQLVFNPHKLNMYMTSQSCFSLLVLLGYFFTENFILR